MFALTAYMFKREADSAGGREWSGGRHNIYITTLYMKYVGVELTINNNSPDNAVLLVVVSRYVTAHD